MYKFTFRMLVLAFLLPIVSSAQKNSIEVIFTSRYSLDSLVSLQHSLVKSHNIFIRYKMLAFNVNGKLKAIDFEADCNDGFKGDAKASNLNKSLPFGFRRDYLDKVVPFKIGFIDK